MRAVVQRVTEARVVVNDEIIGAIGPGLLVLLGCEQGDTDDDLNYIVAKTIAMRVFGDHDGKMNLSVLERGAQVLLVSQFTLFGDMRKGRRPSFTQAMEPGAARSRMLIETTEEILGGAGRIVVVDEGGGVLQHLDLGEGTVNIPASEGGK